MTVETIRENSLLTGSRKLQTNTSILTVECGGLKRHHFFSSLCVLVFDTGCAAEKTHRCNLRKREFEGCGSVAAGGGSQ
jgi:hypothetical protein